MLLKKQRGALLTRQRVCGYKSGPCGEGAQSRDHLGATAPTRSDFRLRTFYVPESS